MEKRFLSHWIYFPLSLLFAALLFRSREEAVFCGMVYAAILGVRLPRVLKPRDHFPLVMLFLFLMVLTQAPVRNFTASLTATIEGLIFFRTLMLTLVLVQNQKGPSDKKMICWILGLVFGLFVWALLLYGSFRPLSPSLIQFAHLTVIGPVMILSSLFTRAMLPGLILGVLCLFPSFQLYGALAFTGMMMALKPGLPDLNEHEPA